jgi:hypothetical protein
MVPVGPLLSAFHISTPMGASSFPLVPLSMRPRLFICDVVMMFDMAYMVNEILFLLAMV